MADRHNPRAGRSSGTDAPLVDLIFPNRDEAKPGSEPWHGAVERAASGQRDPATSHRRVGRLGRLLGRRTKVIQVASGRTGRRGLLSGLPIRRRRVLLGIGTGVVVAGSAGGAAAVLSGVLGGSSTSGRPDTAVDGLGAAGQAESPSAASHIASAATPTWPTPLNRDPELHLLRRATFGPTLVEVVAAKQMGIDAWLERQFNPGTIADPMAEQILATYPTVGMTTEQIRASIKANDYKAMNELGRATLARQMWSTRQLYEVMVDFWSNHLNVTNPFDGGWDTRTEYDNVVIRTHALGTFDAMLRASAQSPAMMRYLDNARSEKRSVNENYGRELLELHTVGVDGGYTEDDVRNSAYIMTGRTVDNTGKFLYDARRHWTGDVKVMDFVHPNANAAEGFAVGDLYLTYLIYHPATARRIAFKLARRFVCDDPPQTLVDRLAQSYLDNETAIIPILRTLFSSVEFWMSNGLKVRTPLENVVATNRIVGVTPGEDTVKGMDAMYYLTDRLGMAPLTWGPPDGFPDFAVAWGSAHATLGTWNAHRSVVLGGAKGLTYPKPESFVGVEPPTIGEYLDTISIRLVHQTMRAEHKGALLAYLGAEEGTPVTDARLGGKVDYLVPLVLDSVYHALR
jgi:uncharacterized protein (DUF1800 family)